jgi:protein-disulfide isomerase
MTRTRKHFAKLPLLTLALCVHGPLAGQSSDELAAIRRDIEALLHGQQAIQKALGEMKAGMDAKRWPVPAGAISLSIEGAPSRGENTAPVTMVEFTDYQCPFCGRHATQVLPTIISDYVNTGRVKYVLRDFPLQSHPDAPKAAEAAYCAGDQGKYWEMHDLIFADQHNLAISDLWARARSLGLDPLRFASCLASGKFTAQVAKSLADAQSAGVEAAPTFFLAPSNPGGTTLKTATKLTGALPFASYKIALDILLPGTRNQ